MVKMNSSLLNNEQNNAFHIQVTKTPNLEVNVDDIRSVGGFSMAPKMLNAKRPASNSLMSLAVPKRQKVNHQLNIIQNEGMRERRNSFAFFQDDIMKSRAMEFMPADL